MKHIHTFESFLNEATNSRYDIYKKPIDWKENPTSNGSYIAKVKNSTLEIISKGYGSWMLKVDGKLVMPTETAKEKTAKDNHTSSFNWSDDMVGALKHTAQELFESVVDESLNENAKAKSLRAEYLSAFTELGELDLEVLLNTDYPIKMVGYLFGDAAKLEKEYKEWLDKKKISQDLAFKHERDFLEQPQIRNKANQAFKAREIVLNKTMKNIEKELFAIYPILKTMNTEMGSSFQAGSVGPILGTAIMKSTGGLWVVETPDEDVFDINITREQAAEYKEYIKSTI